MIIALKQKDNLLFIGSNNMGTEILIGKSGETEIKPVRPMEMLLMAIAGCSSVDIVNILKKQRQTVDNYRVEVKGKRMEDRVPSLFESIEIIYFFEGNLKLSKLQKAITLSLGTYCSVTKIIEETAVIHYSIILNNKLEFQSDH